MQCASPACGKAALPSPEAAAASVQRAQVVAGTVGLSKGKKMALAPRSRGYFLPSGEYKANTSALDLTHMRNIASIDKVTSWIINSSATGV